MITAVEPFRWSGGGADELDRAVVELINHGDEAPGFVIALASQLRDAGHQHCVKTPPDLDVISLAARPTADGGKVEPDHIIGHAAGWDQAASDFQLGANFTTATS